MKSKFSKELNAGTLSLVILTILERSAGPMYGYLIAKSMEKSAGTGGPDIKKGTIYPILRSLEKQGLLSSEVEPSDSGPPRKYYSITKHGQSELKEWIVIWKNTREFVDNALVLDNIVRKKKGK